MENIKILDINESPVSGNNIYHLIIQINNDLYSGLVIKKEKLKEVLI